MYLESRPLQSKRICYSDNLERARSKAGIFDVSSQVMLHVQNVKQGIKHEKSMFKRKKETRVWKESQQNS